MSSHYKWYPSTEEVVVPWNAQYEFPSQANKAIKITPRIPPKNGAVFKPGEQIRLEFPAQGYVNTANTTIEFDVELISPLQAGTPSSLTSYNWTCFFENNIQSIFNRIRILYGSTPLEDLINQNYLVRNLTEMTAHEGSVLGPCSINEGIAGASINTQRFGGTPSYALVNGRQSFIQGTTCTSVTAPAPANFTLNFLNVPCKTNTTNPGSTRRYQVQLVAGLFQQGKLLPVKYMASQLAIEITLEQPKNCIITRSVGVNNPLSDPTFVVSNVNLIPEILEFDSSYDQQFLQGLVSGGVPLQFSSWHHFQTGIGYSSNLSMIIQERSRSVKAIFGFMRLQQPNYADDFGASYGDQILGGGTAKLLSYQYRIGGRYYPASPVIVAQTSATTGGIANTGSTEPFVELQKALNCLGDYRLKQSLHARNWNFPVSGTGAVGPTAPYFPSNNGSGDYFIAFDSLNEQGQPNAEWVPNGVESVLEATNNPSNVFCFSTSLETSNGKEISGLNAEEQSDISLIVNWANAGNVPMQMEVYTYYDALMVLRENNVVELIQ